MSYSSEVFEIDASDAIAPSAEAEGTNAARFAIASTLDPWLLENRYVADEIQNWQEIEAVGLHPGVLRSARASGKHQQVEAGLAFLSEKSRQTSDSVHLREAAWDQLSVRRDATASIALLAAGVCSPLERETTVAATGLLRHFDGLPVETSRGDWQRWTLSFPQSELGRELFASHVPGDDEEIPTWARRAVNWSPARWSLLSERFLDRTLDSDSQIAQLQKLCLFRLQLARRSTDPVTRELAMAYYMREDTEFQAADRSAGPGLGPVDQSSGPSSGNDGRDGGTFPSPPAPPGDIPGGTGTPGGVSTSTVVHGTGAPGALWWYPGGDFHHFIKTTHRADLYEAGREFSWSGTLSSAQRRLAAVRFRRWIQAEGSGEGLRTVFAHSYGGEVVARAVAAGSKIDEVVLLSAPLNQHHAALDGNVRRVSDVRLKFDLTLIGARLISPKNYRNNFTSTTFTTTKLAANYWCHSATHDPTVWIAENIGAKIGL